MSAADAKAAMARAYASGEVPKLDSVSPDGRSEIWTIGNVLFLLPVVPPNAPPELEYALRVRRDASLSGQCDMCDAVLDVEHVDDSGSGLSTGIFPHRGNCLAADENISPMMRAYYEKRDAASAKENLAAASQRTREKVLENLTNRIDIPVTASIEERFFGYLDEKLATAKGRCPHLKSNPAQTWHIPMWDDIWRCDECIVRFGAEYRQRPFLSMIEDHSCDYCRRYSPTYLHQTINRIGNFLLYGAACRRCTQEFQAGNQSAEGET